MPEPADETFFATAPVLFKDVMEIAKPAAEVWEELTSDRPLHWCRALKIGWTSPRPFGVGTTRQAKVLGVVLVIQERFFVWEEGRRFAFYATKATPPMFRRFGEDYVVEPVTDTSCRFTWTIAAEPTLLGKAGQPVNAQIVKSLFKDTRKHFAAR